jgi:hypothetical protein
MFVADGVEDRALISEKGSKFSGHEILETLGSSSHIQ